MELNARGASDHVPGLYRAVIQNSLLAFLEHLEEKVLLQKGTERASRADIGSTSEPTAKDHMRALFDELIAHHRERGETDDAEVCERERERIVREDLSEELPKADARAIDEQAFWSIVEQSVAEADSVDNQIDWIEQHLKSRSGPAIRAFLTRYARAKKSLDHWNVWALAFAARDGCGDDAFDAFRDWLILRGDPALLGRATSDPMTAAPSVPKDPLLPRKSLFGALSSAHLARTGKLPPKVSTSHAKPKGKSWEEDTLREDYPELCDHYGVA